MATLVSALTVHVWLYLELNRELWRDKKKLFSVLITVAVVVAIQSQLLICDYASSWFLACEFGEKSCHSARKSDFFLDR